MDHQEQLARLTPVPFPFLFLFGGSEGKSLPREKWPLWQLFTHYANIYFGAGLGNICSWIVQPCLSETELVCSKAPESKFDLWSDTRLI